MFVQNYLLPNKSSGSVGRQQDPGTHGSLHVNSTRFFRLFEEIDQVPMEILVSMLLW